MAAPCHDLAAGGLTSPSLDCPLDSATFQVHVPRWSEWGCSESPALCTSWQSTGGPRDPCLGAPSTFQRHQEGIDTAVMAHRQLAVPVPELLVGSFHIPMFPRGCASTLLQEVLLGETHDTSWHPPPPAGSHEGLESVCPPWPLCGEHGEDGDTWPHTC